MDWINIDRVQRMTIKEFAEKYNLTLEVKERCGPLAGLPANAKKFYTSFLNVEAGTVGILTKRCGEGDTPEDSVKDYINKISGSSLVIDASKPTRIEPPKTYLSYVDIS